MTPSTSTSTELDTRRTRLAGGGATLLSSHARTSPTGDERHSERQSGQTADSLHSESARRRSRSLHPPSDVTGERIQTASLPGAAGDSSCGVSLCARRSSVTRAVAFHAGGCFRVTRAADNWLLLSWRRESRSRPSDGAAVLRGAAGAPLLVRSSLGAISDARGGVMSELLLDAAGRRRSPATLPQFHAGRPPRNKGMRYPADPPTIEEIVTVMRHAGDGV